jgi:hypothetical protein
LQRNENCHRGHVKAGIDDGGTVSWTTVTGQTRTVTPYDGPLIFVLTTTFRRDTPSSRSPARRSA